MKCPICNPPESCKANEWIREQLAGPYAAAYKRRHDLFNASNAAQNVMQAQPVVPPDPWLPLIRACDDYQPGCCASPSPFCMRFQISPSRERCIECLTANGVKP